MDVLTVDDKDTPIGFALGDRAFFIGLDAAKLFSENLLNAIEHFDDKWIPRTLLKNSDAIEPCDWCYYWAEIFKKFKKFNYCPTCGKAYKKE